MAEPRRSPLCNIVATQNNNSDEDRQTPSPVLLQNKAATVPAKRRATVGDDPDNDDGSNSSNASSARFSPVSPTPDAFGSNEDIAQAFLQATKEASGGDQQVRRVVVSFSEPSSPIKSSLERLPPPPPVAIADPENSADEKQDETGFVAFAKSYLRAELARSVTTAEVGDSAGIEVKRERVHNFLNVPLEFEKLMLLGFWVCADAFLHIFTILPLRFFLAITAMISTRFRLKWTSAQKIDVLKMGLVLMCTYLLQYLDASQLYHAIRGQAVIKLYVIFNVLEIGDRLCCSFGQDILDSLFAKVTENETTRRQIKPTTPTALSIQPLRPIPHFALALIYIFGHTLVLFYQVVTLNVAINSHSNALLTLLVSNQFVEIKGSVFKKENLFQLSCSDIVERFQLCVFLAIITARNCVEIGAVSFDFSVAWFSPKVAASWTHLLASPSWWMDQFVAFPLSVLSELPAISYMFVTSTLPEAVFNLVSQPFAFTLNLNEYMSLFDALVYPILIVSGSEVIVDWLKHAFITKFNQIRPSVYSRFLDILCKDIAMGRRDSLENLDHAPAVARRIGFASIPLACLVIRILRQSLAVSNLKWDQDHFVSSLQRLPWVAFVVVAAFLAALLLKMMIAMYLTRYARERHHRATERTAPTQHFPSASVSSPAKAAPKRPPFFQQTKVCVSDSNLVRHSSADADSPGSPARSPVFPLGKRLEAHNSDVTLTAYGSQTTKVEEAVEIRPRVKEDDQLRDDELAFLEKDPTVRKEQISLENIDRYTLFKSRIP